MGKLPALLLENNSAIHSFTDIFVDKQPKKQFSCEFSGNFATVIVIKVSFCVSAEFSTLRTYISYAAFAF